MRNNSLATRNQFGNIQSLFHDFFRDFGDSFGELSRSSFATGEFVPKLNVSETEDAYKVIAELPGLEEKDFDVTVEDNILRLKGEKKLEKEDKGEHYHRYESSYGSFERVLRLPDAIDTDASEAKFKNGVLTLIIPKDKKASKVKRLKITS
jgi:HSP20 family protein